MANPDVSIGQDGKEQLSRREINTKANLVLLDYAERSLTTLRPLIRAGKAKEVLGYVRNRPEESMHLIDSVGEHLLANIARAHGLSARIIGEQNTYHTIENEEPVVDIPNDSLDNTSPYIRGLDILPYTVASAYDLSRKPVGGVIVDIIGNKIYRSTTSKNTVKDVETEEIKDLFISRRTNLTDENITIASFISEKEYFLPFSENFKAMIEKFHRKGFLYPGGGSFIYSLMASGAVDAYVMMDEPRSEIDPGLPFLLNGGGKAVSVDPVTGRKFPYRFDPELTAAGSVPIFLAYAQESIADQIIELYMEGREQKRIQDDALRFYQGLELRPGEESKIKEFLAIARQNTNLPGVI